MREEISNLKTSIADIKKILGRVTGISTDIFTEISTIDLDGIKESMEDILELFPSGVTDLPTMYPNGYRFKKSEVVEILNESFNNPCPADTVLQFRKTLDVLRQAIEHMPDDPIEEGVYRITVKGECCYVQVVGEEIYGLHRDENTFDPRYLKPDDFSPKNKIKFGEE